MDTKQVTDLLAVLAKSEFAEIELKDADLYLHVKRAAVSQNSTAPTPEQSSAKTVNSPMVGIVHLLDDTKQPFVKVGQKVTTEDTLAQIESMKLFNDIKSPIDGTVTAITVSDGQGVEFAMPLFEISEAD
ncbi:acetyl-CoA carboxylase biotin carboxyl carrier protein [Loigolactobacillus zhaoyuanensis]|uniref:Acetyl-CoA carboxylase biotin carboxyl carrier protein subunit n=1 Tax=Loigolactobacillus zhaoyuanensis TaxID=2486017 RepID=A0ABW8UJ90_9LACO|nr:biotin/lipoyl-containing protein [Loigolactobacillus zhaoyuanensis]